jgi:hypothetical protein
VAGFGQGADAFCDARRERDALAHGWSRCAGSCGLVGVGHVPILRQFERARMSGWSKS